MSWPPASFLILAPLATAMLADDLRKRVAQGDNGWYPQAERPVLYWMVTAINMFVVTLCWYKVLEVVVGWLGR